MPTSSVILMIAVIVIGFLLGSIPCGVLVGKAYGVDPRKGGSKSIGATNVNRTMGTKAGILVMVLDMVKGVIAVGLARIVAYMLGFEVDTFDYDILVFGATVAGICGHIFSPWLHFKGGKGISTGFGTLVMADWRIGLGILAVFIVFAVLTRIVSVGSMAAAISAAVYSVIFHTGSVPAIVLCTCVAVVVVFAHRANVGRLFRGEEPKFSVNKGKAKDND